jgi:hypothetical protein
MIFYKLRSKANPEMFVKGTPVYLSYDKKGRIFQNLGQLRTFLTGCMNTRSRDVMAWDVIELEMTEVAVKDVIDIVKPEKIVALLKRDYNEV